MSSSTEAHLLVVDDHEEMTTLLADQLSDVGFSVDVATDGRGALELVHRRLPDLALVDLCMEQVDGLDVMNGIHEIDDTVPVIIMTAFGAIGTAVEAIKKGAYHYITKPFQLDEIVVYVNRALADRRLRDENRALRRLAQERSSLKSLVGQCKVMRELFDLMERVAATDMPALIRGESGTGKELVARTMHFLGPRSDRPFVAVNCTTLPEALLESELFGHSRGAFTGANNPRRGLFLEADKGTLLLDEIGDMPSELQAKLLRVIEDGAIRPVGSDQRRMVDVRIMAATHQPLEDLVEQGRFREDLFYRINVVPLVIPPLRERPDDIPLLIEHALENARRKNPAAKVRSLTSEARAALTHYSWPGNVRELENVVGRLVVMSKEEEASVEDLRLFAPATLDTRSPLSRAKEELVPLRQLQDEYVQWVLSQCEGNKRRAAEILSVDVSTLYRRKKP